MACLKVGRRIRCSRPREKVRSSGFCSPRTDSFLPRTLSAQRPHRFVSGPQPAGPDNGSDSDVEGAREQQQQQAAQKRSTRGNITGAELANEGDVIITEAKSKKRITLSLHNRDSVVCAVCGQTGHTAGFIGAVYALPLKATFGSHEFVVVHPLATAFARAAGVEGASHWSEKHASSAEPNDC